MVDTHTHILPKVDDGASSPEESLGLIDSLISQGVKDICLTPHYYPFEMPISEFCEKRKNSYDLLVESLGKRDVNLYIGAEVSYSDILFNNEDLHDLCIENTDFMLLELPYVDKFDMKLLSMVERFTDVYGITPIIAHAERYYPIQRKPKICIDLKNMGCLIQINCYSVIEKGRENTTAKKLIKEGLFDLLGSDCHNTYERKANIKSAMEKLSQDYGERICCFLEENAYLMLNNQNPRY